MKPSEQEMLLARLKTHFRDEFQPVQQELAALVGELRARNMGDHQLGAAIGRLEHDLAELRAFVMGPVVVIPKSAPKPEPKPTAKLLKLVEHDDDEKKP